MSTIKKILINTLALSGFNRLAGNYYKTNVPILMLHRFNQREHGIHGHDPKLLKFTLEYLRKRDFNFVSVEDVANSVSKKISLPARSIAFSLDDGYFDQVEESADIFLKYDCPATYFVVSGFVNNELWLWDAKVYYLVESLNEHQIKTLKMEFSGLMLESLNSTEIANRIVFHLSKSPFSEIERVISSLASVLKFEIPAEAPKKYSATSWDALQSIISAGLNVAPHTYSHPILSNESKEDVIEQIVHSRSDLQEKLSDCSNVFCYPVGRAQDFGQREMDIVKELNFDGAVSAQPGVINIKDKSNLFSLPRFAFPDNKEDIIQYSTYIEAFKDRIRKR